MDAVSLSPRAAPAAPTWQSLTRPLREDERRALWGEQVAAAAPDELANALEAALTHGSAREREAAQAICYGLIHRALVESMLAPHGALHQHALNLNESTRLLEGSFR